MKKISFLFLALVLFIFNSAFPVYASLENKKGNTENGNTNLQGQSMENKLKKIRWEFSIAASLDAKRLSSESPYFNYKIKTTTITIPARIGYFLTKNIEMEPEINFIHTWSSSYSETQALLLFNAAFNLINPTRVVPFVLFGAGMINVWRSASWEMIEPERPEFAWNVGAGFKFFISQKVAFRIDYRYLSYSLDYIVDGSQKDSYTHHKILLGLAFYF